MPLVAARNNNATFGRHLSPTSVLGLGDLTFEKHIDYRPWGCHMCKFLASLSNRASFPRSKFYDTTKAFVKMDVSQFAYSFLATKFFPDIVVTPPVKLLVELDGRKIQHFRLHAPSNNVPTRRVIAWRQEREPVFASITPLFHTAYLNHGRRLYDGSGDCTNFMNRPDNVELFQIVFLDFLFGNRDRIANCFTLSGALLLLDTGFNRGPFPQAVNYGSPSDYLAYHLERPSICRLRHRHGILFSNLRRFTNHSEWLSEFTPYDRHGQAFRSIQTAVHTRARSLVSALQRCK